MTAFHPVLERAERMVHKIPVASTGMTQRVRIGCSLIENKPELVMFRLKYTNPALRRKLPKEGAFCKGFIYSLGFIWQKAQFVLTHKLVTGVQRPLLVAVAKRKMPFLVFQQKQQTAKCRSSFFTENSKRQNAVSHFSSKTTNGKMPFSIFQQKH